MNKTLTEKIEEILRDTVREIVKGLPPLERKAVYWRNTQNILTLFQEEMEEAKKEGAIGQFRKWVDVQKSKHKGYEAKCYYDTEYVIEEYLSLNPLLNSEK
jgi:hypothetical protein